MRLHSTGSFSTAAYAIKCNAGPIPLAGAKVGGAVARVKTQTA